MGACASAPPPAPPPPPEAWPFEKPVAPAESASGQVSKAEQLNSLRMIMDSVDAERERYYWWWNPHPNESLLSMAQRILATLPAQRGVKPVAEVALLVLPRERFARELQTSATARLEATELLRVTPMHLAFGFISALGQPPSMSEVLSERVPAFDAPRPDRVFLQDLSPKGSVGPGGVVYQAVVAKAVTRAVQRQLVPLPEASRQDGLDHWLATLALFEGDVAATTAALSAGHGISADEAIAFVGNGQMRLVPGTDLVGRFGYGEVMAQVPAVFREQALFPEIEGAMLASALYRTGGFGLIDKALRAPPVSTEQVLHPDRYVAGEMPLLIDRPALPAGHKELASGTLGEFRVRVLLARCASRDEAAQAASGWGGDRYLVSENGTALGLQWSTAWDTADDATEFARLLDRVSDCVAPALARTGRWALPAGFVVKRSGTRVAVVRGLPPAMQSPTLDALLALSVQAQPSPPALSSIRVVQAVARPVSEGRLQKGRFEHPILGVTAQVDAQLEARLGDLGAALEVDGGGTSVAHGSFGFVADRENPPGASNDRNAWAGWQDIVFQSLTEPMRLQLLSKGVVQDGEKEVSLLGRRGWERTFSYAQSVVRMRATVVPVCGEKSAFFLVEAWADEASKEALDRWAASFSRLGGGEPKACAGAAPKKRAAP